MGSLAHWEFFCAIGAIASIAVLILAFWIRMHRHRAGTESVAITASIPESREGLMVSALVLEILPHKKPADATANVISQPWFTEAVHAVTTILERSGLTLVGSFQETIMAISQDDRDATLSLQRAAGAAIQIRDAVHVIGMRSDIALSFRLGIHADIIPVSGLGSTLALSRLWQGALATSESAPDGGIEISAGSRKWLGEEFSFAELAGRPRLTGKPAA